jgi:hypothetical protein
MLPVHDLHATGMVTERTGSAPMTKNSALVTCASLKIDSKTRINYRVYDGGLVEFSIDDGAFGPLTTEPGVHDLAERTHEALRPTLSAALSAPHPATTRPSAPGVFPILLTPI